MGWRRHRERDNQPLTSALLGLISEIDHAVLANDAPRAWGATWDLIAAHDSLAASRTLALLQPHIAAAYTPTQSTSSSGTGAAANSDTSADTRIDITASVRDHTMWQRAELALAIIEAIEHANEPVSQRILSSREVLKHHDAEQTRKFQRSLARAGVRSGEGLPAWMLYMSRRKNKTWD